MPRRPGYHWHKRDQCYRTDVGGRTKYFRGIARGDQAGIAAAFAAHLAELDAEARPAEPDVLAVCLAFAGAARGIKPRTLRTHKERLAKFCTEPAPGWPEGYAARPARELTATDLRRVLRAWEAQGVAAHYRAGICRSVKAAWAWAASEDGGKLIPANPLGEVEGPKVGRSPQRYAERREVAAFLRFAWRRASSAPGVYRRFGRLLCLLIRVAAHTGARPGDLAAAWWSDFDADRETITLPPDRHKTGGKTDRARVVYLNATGLMRSMLRERDRPCRHPVSVFTHKRGKGAVGRGAEALAGEPWGKFVTLPDGRPSFDTDTGPLTRAVRGLRREAVAEAARRRAAGEPLRGLDLIRDAGAGRFVLYLMRHTTASDHLMSGGNPSVVAELLGTSVKMLETTYGHLMDDHLKSAAGELARKRRSGGK